MTIDGQSIDPPEVQLSAPTQEQGEWFVVARNQRVNHSWEKLIQRHPENTARCYQYLCSTPTQRYPGRIFPLKGKKYRGAWEYELTGGDRVFYVPDEVNKKVVVYYADKHPKGKSPTPP
ncbi:MAG: hypothetical protein WA902_10540 [Thermosynechococcaceae cyanobacterium]